jgi:hypothetical protein
MQAAANRRKQAHHSAAHARARARAHAHARVAARSRRGAACVQPRAAVRADRRRARGLGGARRDGCRRLARQWVLRQQADARTLHSRAFPSPRLRFVQALLRSLASHMHITHTHTQHTARAPAITHTHTLTVTHVYARTHARERARTHTHEVRLAVARSLSSINCSGVNNGIADGVFYGGGAALLGAQCAGVAAVGAYSVVVSWALLALIQLAMPLRARWRDTARHMQRGELCCNAMRWTALQRVVLRCKVLCCVAIHRAALQRVAVGCNVLHCAAIYGTSFQRVMLCRNITVLRCNVYTSRLQRVALRAVVCRTLRQWPPSERANEQRLASTGLGYSTSTTGSA